MKTDRTWHGVRLRQTEAGSDPDAPNRIVRLPVAWEEPAAVALCDLVPGPSRIICLPEAAQGWIRPLAAAAKEAGLADLPARLHALLLLRRGAPSAGIWRGTPMEAPGFVLNLPAFHDAATGFDVAAFAEAVDTAAQTLRLAAPDAGPYAVSMADLAGLLALLGLDYAGQPARDVAACLAAILRGRVDAALAGPQPDLLAAIPSWPAPPDSSPVRGLAAAAAEARALALRCGGAVPGTAIVVPGPVEALLGVETGGIAPAFAPVGPAGLTRSARAWLTARAIPLDTALAAALAGEPVFPVAHLADHIAMHDAVAPMLHAMPPRPAAAPQPGIADVRREELPARRRGFTQKAAIGGHRIFLRTGEYADGRLGEIDIALPRENATVRGLADSFATAVSLGLQHGVPLDAFVDAFTHLRFGPAGMVENDPAVDRATSIPDYVFRSLAATYLGRSIAPDDIQEDPMPAEPTPLLPLDLPRAARRRPALRLVAG